MEERILEKKIVKDILFLSQVSQPASQEDLPLAKDLQDTLQANRESCVGLAANMIGVQKRVIIFNIGMIPMVMFNPVLQSFEGPYETEEGCLSLTGVRPTTRYYSKLQRYPLARADHYPDRFSGADLSA